MMDSLCMEINGRAIGEGKRVYIIAEMSANHNGSIARAKEIIEAAKESGADAVKLQTYTPDTITLDSDNDCFRVKEGPWAGSTLYDLYSRASMPWAWQPELKDLTEKLGMDFLSAPFDGTAVDFLEKMNILAFKVASFELVDIPLLKRVGQTGKPVILSTGMASLDEIDEAVAALNDSGCQNLGLLKCTSSYPSAPESMNLATIPDMRERFGLPIGISDHSEGVVVSIASVALGASIVERHFTVSREGCGIDDFFSLEPEEFREMVDGIRTVEKSLGDPDYGCAADEDLSRRHRRSLFVVRDMAAGEMFSDDNLKSIRPAMGMHTRYYEQVVGQRAACDIRKGTPLEWDYVERFDS